jgi:PAS domain S-box-containing protein
VAARTYPVGWWPIDAAPLDAATPQWLRERMPSPRSDNENLPADGLPISPADGLSISDEAIDPGSPPDAKDAFKLLVDGASEYAVFTLSPWGVVSTWNRGAARIKGYQRDEIVGQHFSVFYPDDQREAGVPEQELRDAVADGRVVTEGWRVRRDGSQFWANVVITPLWDGAGRLRGFAKLTRDETDRRAAAEASEQLARITEQERIASVLADTMIRRLFTIGLQLSGVLNLTTGLDRQRIEAAINEADNAISELRRAVFNTGRGPGKD